jgi:hypothetical protein
MGSLVDILISRRQVLNKPIHIYIFFGDMTGLATYQPERRANIEIARAA